MHFFSFLLSFIDFCGKHGRSLALAEKGSYLKVLIKYATRAIMHGVAISAAFWRGAVSSA